MPPEDNHQNKNNGNGLYRALFGVGAALALHIIIFAFGYGVLWQKVESQAGSAELILRMSEQIATLTIKVENIENRLDRISNERETFITLARDYEEDQSNGGTQEEQRQRQE